MYDTTVIYSRVIGIQASSRELDLKKVLRHELAPVPTSMFHDSGAVQMCKAKSDLKKRLAREHFQGLLKLTRLQLFLAVLPYYGSCIGQRRVLWSIL